MTNRFRVSSTLPRKLQELGVSPASVLRHANLLHSSLDLNETAYLLGHEDAHSFFRAFHDWEGSPPGEWRARH
jgi:AraC-like DNA-binding protein